ncbi:malectin domain-containing carbohydrate-binding protein [Pinibacter soli]|uniref:Malectin domain-containing carbohydrate-binding protein n=1 Tax=Pinibacter soli TaxID=3044211 RepID=A0ABT6RH55_9BACT|nr:malectin domain-containing carbohydrate-binding protein [Pinibacter soli]MDI3321167.1 malectin domain-containing carbohydrate-binding protein [Pinibacter soli]
MFKFKRIASCLLFLLSCAIVFPQGLRKDESLNKSWYTKMDTSNDVAAEAFNARDWQMVNVPHNWDQYDGYRRLKHGNKHGTAWYRKSFSLKDIDKTKRYFLWFEGVGSYATVWLNGKQIGQHAGGRTTFTIDITNAICKENSLIVKAAHPAMISDLPWVCGGCSDDRGFSEGSQPLGIFRPVHLITTGPVRVEPFGVHVWNDNKISSAGAVLHMETEVRNYASQSRKIVLVNTLLDASNKVVEVLRQNVTLTTGETKTIPQQTKTIANPHLWSLENPYLYRLQTTIEENGKVSDQDTVTYGIRWISWPQNRNDGSKQFLLNGEPVFINGTCEYEHLMGKSHAFSEAQIKARVKQIESAGFNAFRDAHQPHNLLYQKYWDHDGILWWPQFSAHVWVDSREFRENFKTLLREWIKERRNSPSAILWGLQNESVMPADFAKECSDIIRELDPTASNQRMITTCNGGEGTDWNVPQNWTGTYGGDPNTYGDDLKKQLLVGEYGGWRSLGLHAENDSHQKTNTEEKMTELMELKVRLAESVKDSTCGHFHWLFASHENPGRSQGGEGMRELDRIGPVNYKGLFTAWGEPTDAFYMYRSNYADKVKEPMVYIVSHTWPDRWMTAGMKDGIVVYSNCDEVELFNDADKTISLGKRNRNGIGTHFEWNKVNVQYNVLYAEARLNGKVVAHDMIVFHHLPEAKKKSTSNETAITKGVAGYNYLYRVNCGGGNYKDVNGNIWHADVDQKVTSHWGSVSWTKDFPGISPFYASQRTTNEPIANTSDNALFQSFRYGMDKLQYDFPVPNGDYLVELFFAEPWYGAGGSLNCKGWRMFDVAINDKTVLRDFDIFKEAGFAKAIKKAFNVHVTNGRIKISFPDAAAGEAIINAIAIGTKNVRSAVSSASSPMIANFKTSAAANNWETGSWLNTGDKVFVDKSVSFASLPPELYGAEWLKVSSGNQAGNSVLASFTTSEAADVYVAVADTNKELPSWLTGFSDAQKKIVTDENGGKEFSLKHKRVAKNALIEVKENCTVFVNPASNMEGAYDLKPTTKYEAEKATLTDLQIAKEELYGKQFVEFEKGIQGSIAWNIYTGVADVYSLHFKYLNTTGKKITMRMKLVATDGLLITDTIVEFPVREGKWGVVDSSTGTFINAGTYRIILSPVDGEGLRVDALEVQ